MLLETSWVRRRLDMAIIAGFDSLKEHQYFVDNEYARIAQWECRRLMSV